LLWFVKQFFAEMNFCYFRSPPCRQEKQQRHGDPQIAVSDSRTSLLSAEVAALNLATGMDFASGQKLLPVGEDLPGVFPGAKHL
jgi:hypothetical protein